MSSYCDEKQGRIDGSLLRDLSNYAAMLGISMDKDIAESVINGTLSLYNDITSDAKYVHELRLKILKEFAEYAVEKIGVEDYPLFAEQFEKQLRTSIKEKLTLIGRPIATNDEIDYVVSIVKVLLTGVSKTTDAKNLVEANYNRLRELYRMRSFPILLEDNDLYEFLRKRHLGEFAQQIEHSISYLHEESAKTGEHSAARAYSILLTDIPDDAVKDGIEIVTGYISRNYESHAKAYVGIRSRIIAEALSKIFKKLPENARELALKDFGEYVKSNLVHRGAELIDSYTILAEALPEHFLLTNMEKLSSAAKNLSLHGPDLKEMARSMSFEQQIEERN